MLRPFGARNDKKIKYNIMIKRKFKETPGVQNRDKICRKIIEYGILSVIVFSPLPAASVHEWSILVIEIVVLVMMAAYILMKERPQNNELLSSFSFRSSLCLILWSRSFLRIFIHFRIFSLLIFLRLNS